jgi:2-keto-3-deoxy-L-rhamnonate aldolase RhmA
MMNRLHKAISARSNTPLLGIALYFYDPVFLEIAVHMGFHVIWIEMEHGFITFAEAADLCRMAAARGVLTMIRIPDSRRESVLKAAECGPDIIDLPMANSPDVIRELVRHARFAPSGARGFFSVSRAVNYGMVDSVPEEQQRINQDLCLMAQIETEEAVTRIEELCSVPDIDIFIGPSDLSASLGIPGETSHPRVAEAAARAIRVAKEHGRAVAVGASPADFKFWVQQGVDLLFCGNDVACLKLGAKALLEEARNAIGVGKGKHIEEPAPGL